MQATVLRPPPVARLVSDPKAPTRLDAAHSGRQKAPVLGLEPQPALASLPRHQHPTMIKECCDKREKAPERSGLVAPCRTLGPAALLCRRWRARRARCAATGRARRWMPSATGVLPGPAGIHPEHPAMRENGPTLSATAEKWTSSDAWGAARTGCVGGPSACRGPGLLCAGLGRVCSGQDKAPNGRTTIQGLVRHCRVGAL